MEIRRDVDFSAQHALMVSWKGEPEVDRDKRELLYLTNYP
jgi:hypothetical protein